MDKALVQKARGSEFESPELTKESDATARDCNTSALPRRY